jgi:hypothetical protein
MAIGDGVIYQSNVIPPPPVSSVLSKFEQVYTGYCTWQYYSSGVSINAQTPPVELCAELCDCITPVYYVDFNSNSIRLQHVLRCKNSEPGRRDEYTRDVHLSFVLILDHCADDRNPTSYSDPYFPPGQPLAPPGLDCTLPYIGPEEHVIYNRK